MTKDQIVQHEALCLAIRQRREELKMTQQEVADRIGWDAPRYANLEQGRNDPRYSTLQKVCKALGVSLAEIEQRAANVLLTN